MWLSRAARVCAFGGAGCARPAHTPNQWTTEERVGGCVDRDGMRAARARRHGACSLCCAASDALSLRHLSIASVERGAWQDADSRA